MIYYHNQHKKIIITTFLLPVYMREHRILDKENKDQMVRWKHLLVLKTNWSFPTPSKNLTLHVVTSVLFA